MSQRANFQRHGLLRPPQEAAAMPRHAPGDVVRIRQGARVAASLVGATGTVVAVDRQVEVQLTSPEQRVVKVNANDVEPVGSGGAAPAAARPAATTQVPAEAPTKAQAEAPAPVPASEPPLDPQEKQRQEQQRQLLQLLGGSLANPPNGSRAPHVAATRRVPLAPPREVASARRDMAATRSSARTPLGLRVRTSPEEHAGESTRQRAPRNTRAVEPTDEETTRLLEDWAAAKKARDYTTADNIRQSLRTAGIEPDDALRRVRQRGGG